MPMPCYGFETNWNGQKEHVSVWGGNKKIYFMLTGGYRDYGNYQSGNAAGTILPTVPLSANIIMEAHWVFLPKRITAL